MNIINSIRKVFVPEYEGGVFTSSYFSTSGRTKKERLNDYRNLVYACVNLIAEEVGRYEPILEKDGKEINHHFLNVLNSPNPESSKFDLLSASQIYLELTGELYWYMPKGEFTKKIRQIYLLRPDRVTREYDNDKRLIGYKYRRNDGTDQIFTTDEVEAYSLFNPVGGNVGYSPTEAGHLYIEGENVTSEFQTNFIKNQATPSGIISIKNKLGRELFNKLKTQWRREHSGTKNAGNTVFINGGDLEYTKMGLSLSDINLKELKDVTEKKVLQMFRVPSALLGETDSTGLGRANIETIEYIFAKRTIEPKLVRFDDFIERIIRNHYKEKVKVSHVSTIPQDLEFKLKLIESGKDIWLTRNEIRELSELGLEPIEGGDKLFVNMGMSEVEKSYGKITVKMKSVKKPVKLTKKVTKGIEDLYRKLDNEEEKGYKIIKKEVAKFAKAQEKLVLEKIPLLGKRIKAFEEFFVDLDEVTAKEVEKIFITIIQVIENGGEVTVSFAGYDIDFALSQGVRDSVFQSTERLMRSFNKETTEKIQKQLADGLRKNESVSELAKRVESIYEEAKGYRAERIARTEAHRAINEGNMRAYEQVGYKKFKWVAWGDACPFCKELHGKTVDVGMPFINKGETLVSGDQEFLADYDDVRYADLHPNCRCKIEPYEGD